jgi:chromosomal replication initiator protein
MSDGAAVESQVFALSLTSPAVAERANSSPKSTTTRGDFIVGPENRLAGQTIQWLLDRDAHCYSPVVLCGLPGTGKSHLAQGVASSRSDAVCTNAAEFVRELADALENKTVESLRAKYRGAAALVFEDLAQLAGYKAAQQELRHTVDALEAREVPVIITSRLPPAEIAGLPKTLRSRLSGGLVVTVSLPGTDARKMIVERLAAGRGISLSADAAKLLAEGLNVTAAELNGALLELEMNYIARPCRSGGEAPSGNGNSSATPSPQPVRPSSRQASPARGEGIRRSAIGVDEVRRYLAARRKAIQPTLKQIAALVAKYYGVKPAALASASRRRQTVSARSLAIYLGRQLTGLSLQALGNQFGNRDHTTVLHSIRSIEKRLPTDADLRTAVSTLRQLLSEM